MDYSQLNDTELCAIAQEYQQKYIQCNEILNRRHGLGQLAPDTRRLILDQLEDRDYRNALLASQIFNVTTPQQIKERRERRLSLVEKYLDFYGGNIRISLSLHPHLIEILEQYFNKSDMEAIISGAKDKGGGKLKIWKSQRHYFSPLVIYSDGVSRALVSLTKSQIQSLLRQLVEANIGIYMR